MDMTPIFNQLREHYGNHSAAARALDIQPRTYREYRSTPEKIPAPMIRYLELAARATNGESQE